MTACEITQETVRKRYGGSTEFIEHNLECAERQNRLLLALMKNEEALNKLMTYLLADEAWACLDTDHANVFGIEELETILAPVYSGMNRDDAEYFQISKEQNAFSDSVDILLNSFEMKCVGADLTELRVIAEGCNDNG